MKISCCELDGVLLIEPAVFRDARGFFLETWQQKKFKDAGLDVAFVQNNHSRSCVGTLRGLHYQKQFPQGKLVRVARGSVFDVAVDLRKNSKTFGRWFGQVLSDENCLMMYVPPGFAHGFLVLSEIADFEYFCTEFYRPDDERAIKWDDPQIGIEWPFLPGMIPVLSAKDANAGSFAEAETF